MILSPNISQSIEKAVGVASIAFGAAMVDGDYYLFTTNIGCWIAQGAAPVATAGSGSMYVPANAEPIVIRGHNGADLAVIQDAAAGKASLTPASTF